MKKYNCFFDKKDYVYIKKINKEKFLFQMKHLDELSEVVLEKNQLENLIKDLEEMVNE